MRAKVFFILLILTQFAWSQDFGGLISEQALLKIADKETPSLANNVKASIFASYGDELWSFRTLGSLTHQFQDSNQLIHLDLDLFVIKFIVPKFLSEQGLLHVTLGRSPYFDSSRLVVNGLLDQLDVQFNNHPFKIQLGAGYSGLISKYSSGFIYNIKDQSDNVSSNQYFTSPRLFAWFNADWEVMPLMVIGLGYLRQQDLRQLVNPGYSPAKKDDFLFQPQNSPAFDTNYVLFNALSGFSSLGLKLGLSAALSQGSSLTYVSGDAYKDIPHLGWALGVKADWSPLREVSFLSFTALISSGDSKDRFSFYEGTSLFKDLQQLSTFRSATALNMGRVFQPKLGNLILFSLKWTHFPLPAPALGLLSGFSYSLEVLPSLRMANGPLSEAINPNSDQNYLGTEAILSFDWRLTSDFSLGFFSAWFFANQSSGAPFQNLRPSYENMNSFNVRVIF